MDVEPVLPTKASTRSRLLTDRAVKYASVKIRVVRSAKRVSDMGAVPWSPRETVAAADTDDDMRPLPDCERLGRHFKTASNEARQG